MTGCTQESKKKVVWKIVAKLKMGKPFNVDEISGNIEIQSGSSVVDVAYIG